MKQTSMNLSTGNANLEQRVREKIRAFDPPSLLKLLNRLGYKASDIYFESNPNLSSAISLFESIQFFDQLFPKIIIVVNLGLLTGHSPLPTFFRKKMEHGVIDPILFTRFLGFFDHFSISTLFSMSIPEENGWFFSDWKQTLSQYLHLLALNSTSTLWHLFQLCFPELKVEVTKFARILQLQSSSITLGQTTLGKESFLGRNKSITISSIKVVLTSEEMDTSLGTPWAKEIKKRLQELIFPSLQKINVYLQVLLVVKNCKDVITLSSQPLLGFRSLGQGTTPLKLLLFSGHP